MILPSHIGQYRILRKIGAGGMGLVYLGEHTLLGRRAAIKTLLPTVAANREIVERFFNEARATSAIADPGVIQIFDFGYHVDGTAYIVMELLEGEALSARLDRLGKLPLGDALRFARQIAGSLAAAHARDIIHRDLKPENIFLVRDSEAQGGERTKIIDFGICKVGAGDPMLTEVGAMIGTPAYMSPEQCRGSGEVDHRSDIYTFGCVLFHLITGRPPFLGEASGELIVAHLQEPAPAASQHAPELPPAVDALLASCLAKSPDDRFASMTALHHALGELAAHCEIEAPATASPPPPTVPLGRGFRSVYDANLAAVLGRSWGSVGTPEGSPAPGARPGATHPLRARLLFAPPPETPSGDALDDDDEIERPRRRAGVRAALACVLVVGVTLGLIGTLAMDHDAPPPARTTPAALAVEPPAAAGDPPRAPAEAPGSAAAQHEAALATADPPSPTADPPSPTAAPPSADPPTADPPSPTADPPSPTADPPSPSADPRQPSAAPPHPTAKPSPRPRTSGRAIASASRTPRPTRPPASASPASAAPAPDPAPAAPPMSVPAFAPVTPTPARTPMMPPVPAAAPVTAPSHAESARAPAAPASPPSEDLYDSR